MKVEPAIQTRLRPFAGRVSVVESPVDETELPSGVVVPTAFDGDDAVKRGIVVAVDHLYWERSPYKEAVEQIDVGSVVFYRGGVAINDVTILNMPEIVAYEADE